MEHVQIEILVLLPKAFGDTCENNFAVILVEKKGGYVELCVPGLILYAVALFFRGNAFFKPWYRKEGRP